MNTSSIIVNSSSGSWPPVPTCDYTIDLHPNFPDWIDWPTVPLPCNKGFHIDYTCWNQHLQLWQDICVEVNYNYMIKCCECWTLFPTVADFAKRQQCLTAARINCQNNMVLRYDQWATAGLSCCVATPSAMPNASEGNNGN